MSSNPAQVYVRSIQKRILKVSLIVAIVLGICLTPLIVSGSLRLDLAYRFDLVPGADVERIANADVGTTLIVVPIEVQIGPDRSETRFRATYLAKALEDTTQLTNLADGSIFNVELERLDFIATDAAGDHLLMTQGDGRDGIHVLVTVATNSVEALPQGKIEPDIPGDWSTSILTSRIGRTCLGISPQQTYIACFESPTLAKYLAGDWQIDIHRYGQYKLSREIFRGSGTQPITGFTADDSWLYFQNENGIWREPMSLDMFNQ